MGGLLKSEYFKNGLLIKLVALFLFAATVLDVLVIMTVQMIVQGDQAPSSWVQTVFWACFGALLFILGVHVGAIPGATQIFGGAQSPQSTTPPSP